ncbi:MAG: hypothetical protein ACTSU2_06080 [Promethearchaeota archaeon]
MERTKMPMAILEGILHLKFIKIIKIPKERTRKATEEYLKNAISS